MSTRDLTIKTGVLKRTLKEKDYYNKEKKSQEDRITKMIEDGSDEYDIKKQREVLQETLDMLPDVDRRLKSAQFDLENLVANAGDDLKQTSEYEKAVQDLEALKA
ncbi:MAG: tubulin binding cofactor A [Benniella sp.]|nr:MAG: tubulin binding cofactor A [Benniella sp.]